MVVCRPVRGVPRDARVEVQLQESLAGHIGHSIDQQGNKQSCRRVCRSCTHDIDTVLVEVVFALPDRAYSVGLELDSGTRADEAFRLALETPAFEDAPSNECVALSVWGELVESDHVLADGDRLELLRPLPTNPMELRRVRAENEKAQS